MTEVAGRTAFVTGGANGIGLGIARALARSGARLALADADGAGLDRVETELAEHTEVRTFRLDVRDRDAFAAAADEAEAQLGPVSLLLNNAGVAGSGSLDDLTYSIWDWTLGINLGGVINGLQTFLPRMRASGHGGHIVNTASASGLVGGTATVAYCTAKAAVVGLSESLRVELDGTRIGVSVLCPGPVATSILTHSARSRASDLGDATSAVGRPTGALDRGADPDAVGQRVLDAISAQQFYIHTDRVMLRALEDRHCELIAAMPDGPMNPFTAELSAAFSQRRFPFRDPCDDGEAVR